MTWIIYQTFFPQKALKNLISCKLFTPTIYILFWCHLTSTIMMLFLVTREILWKSGATEWGINSCGKDDSVMLWEGCFAQTLNCDSILDKNRSTTCVHSYGKCVLFIKAKNLLSRKMFFTRSWTRFFIFCFIFLFNINTYNYILANLISI